MHQSRRLCIAGKALHRLVSIQQVGPGQEDLHVDLMSESAVVMLQKPPPLSMRCPQHSYKVKPRPPRLPWHPREEVAAACRLELVNERQSRSCRRGQHCIRVGSPNPRSRTPKRANVATRNGAFPYARIINKRYGPLSATKSKRLRLTNIVRDDERRNATRMRRSGEKEHAPGLITC